MGASEILYWLSRICLAIVPTSEKSFFHRGKFSVLYKYLLATSIHGLPYIAQVIIINHA